jgi:hypothetical protein
MTTRPISWDDIDGSTCEIWVGDIRGAVRGCGCTRWEKGSTSVMNMVGTRSRAQEEVLSRLSTQLQASECLQSMNTLRAVVTATIVEIHKFGSVGVRTVTM